jgi:drug/metabolite transporter (DMT)-like permease
MFCALLGPIGYGVANVLNKITGNAVGTDRSVFLQTSFAAIFATVATIIFFSFGEVNVEWYLIAFSIGLAGYFPLFFFIKAITTGKAGVVVPIVDLATVVALVCTYIFFGQTVSNVGLFFVVMILLGVVLLSIKVRDFKQSKIFDLRSGVFYAIVAAVLWGSSYFLWSLPTSVIGPFVTSIILEIGTCTASLITILLIKQEKFVGTIPKNIWLVGALVGFCGFLGTFGINLSISQVGAPITFAVLGARPAVSALVSYFYFKESLNLKQIFAMLIIMIGVAGVALFK